MSDSVRPPLTDDADRPLSSDELADDLARSPQDGDQDVLRDAGASGNTGLPASEAEIAGGGTSREDGDQPGFGIDRALTNLPPG